MTDIKCLDSSAWLEYFAGQSPEVKELVESGGLIVTSSLTLFEVKKKLLKLKKDYKELLNIIKQRGTIIVPGVVISEKASEISIEKKLAAVDSLIYTTSLVSGAELITFDNDFKGLVGVKIIT